MSANPNKPDSMRRLWARRRRERIEMIEDMIECGRSWEEICASFRLGPDALETWLRRHGRSDLMPLAKGDLAMAQRMIWKAQAKARLGLPANCNDETFYRAVAMALKRGELIPNDRLARKKRLMARGRRLRAVEETGREAA